MPPTRTIRTSERRPGSCTRSSTRALLRSTRRVTSYRFVAGIKGPGTPGTTTAGCPIGGEADRRLHERRVNWRAKIAILNRRRRRRRSTCAVATAYSPAYAALPPGTFWRIGENAGLNSPAMYDSLVADERPQRQVEDDSDRLQGSREFATPGRPVGAAIGAEIRREDNELPHDRNRRATHGLSLLRLRRRSQHLRQLCGGGPPVLKNLEINGALRYDHYTDAGSSTDAEGRHQVAPLNNFALRGTYARASGRRRRPRTASAVSPRSRPPRIPGALPACRSTIDANCSASLPTFIQRGNPDLEPEKSTSITLGLVLESPEDEHHGRRLGDQPQEEINRRNRPQPSSRAKSSATRAARCPAVAGDPGPLVVVLGNYVNSSKSLSPRVRRRGEEAVRPRRRQRRVTLTAPWTHLFEFKGDGGRRTRRAIRGHARQLRHHELHRIAQGSCQSRRDLATAARTGSASTCNYRASIVNKFSRTIRRLCQRTSRTAPTFLAVARSSRSRPWTSSVAGCREEPGDLRLDPNVFDRKPPIDVDDLRCRSLQPARLCGRDWPLLPRGSEVPVLAWGQRVNWQSPGTGIAPPRAMVPAGHKPAGIFC